MSPEMNCGSSWARTTLRYMPAEIRGAQDGGTAQSANDDRAEFESELAAQRGGVAVVPTGS